VDAEDCGFGLWLPVFSGSRVESSASYGLFHHARAKFELLGAATKMVSMLEIGIWIHWSFEASGAGALQSCTVGGLERESCQSTLPSGFVFRGLVTRAFLQRWSELWISRKIPSDGVLPYMSSFGFYV
jgi:hypothetical protein